MTRGNLKKPLFWTNIIVLVVFGLTMADVIFGWTNPSSGPPTPPGVLRANSGEVGIGVDPVGGNRLTVSGILNVQSNRITGVAAPTASTDAATKAYVDAQAGGSDANAGGITTVTLFGTAPTQVLGGTNLFRGGNSAVPQGCHTNQGLCNFLLTTLWGYPLLNYQTAVPAPGEGTTACSSLSLPPASSGTWEWFEIFAGYGPHETVVNSFAISGLQPTPNPGDLDMSSFAWQVDVYGPSGYGDVQDNDIPTTAVSVSDSVCGDAVQQNVSVVNSINGNQISTAAGRNSACTPYECNTCRICGLVRTVAP